jgi:hypothetical protein
MAGQKFSSFSFYPELRICFEYDLYFSDHSDYLLLPTSTGNEKYETFLDQAKKNIEKEFVGYETLNHFENIEEMPEDESTEVASLCAECVCRQYVQRSWGMMSLRDRRREIAKAKKGGEGWQDDPKRVSSPLENPLKVLDFFPEGNRKTLKCPSQECSIVIFTSFFFFFVVWGLELRA